ncbi:MAG TPA: phosphate signaling complex protein PhoU [Burkholderiaceae bacterium]|jgi:phosphate transport system protein|nr:phosphate signaling complex protein PhoU [Burkholderiaceae bacterium]
MSIRDHLVRKYDEELEAMRSRVLQMGGLVESQVRTALDAFERVDLELAQQAIDADKRVNELEMDVDQMVNHVIARRQPTAGDLRMITGIAKVITDLERIGDEASKIARAVKWLHEKHDNSRLNRIPDIKYSGEAAASMLRRTLDAFARMDPVGAASIIKDDLGIDDRFRAVLRQLITFMMEDPRTISASLDCVWVAKAIERIGDHAKNVAEHVIFISQGWDARHQSLEDVERAVARA